MRILISLCFVMVVACGGAAEPGSDSVPVAPSAESGGESRGTAAEGGECDFGGAERYTCTGGLVCCYPEEGEVAYGTCLSVCPGYE